MDYSKDESARGRVHINGTEGFWGMAKLRRAKFKALLRPTFHLHLKETNGATTTALLISPNCCYDAPRRTRSVQHTPYFFAAIRYRKVFRKRSVSSWSVK